MLTGEQKELIRSWFSTHAAQIDETFNVEFFEDFEIYADLVAMNDFVTLNSEVNKFVHSLISAVAYAQ